MSTGACHCTKLISNYTLVVPIALSLSCLYHCFGVIKNTVQSLSWQLVVKCFQ